MSRESGQPCSKTPRRQLHPGQSSMGQNPTRKLKEGTYFSRMVIVLTSSIPTCPQADRDSGSQTTAAKLSVVHWEKRLAKDFNLRLFIVHLMRSPSELTSSKVGDVVTFQPRGSNRCLRGYLKHVISCHVCILKRDFKSSDSFRSSHLSVFG